MGKYNDNATYGVDLNDLENHINNFFEKNTLKDIIYRVNKNQNKELNQ